MGAAFLDYFFIFGILTNAYDARSEASPEVASAAALTATIVAAASLLATSVLMVTRRQSLGGWLCGLRVVQNGTSRLTSPVAWLGRVLLPYSATWFALTVPLGMLVLIAANFFPLWLHPEKRSLLDLITRSRLVRR